MARRVFFHIGAPKSGTTYLQDIMWKNKRVLRQQGVLLPQQRRDHLYSTLVVREDPNIGRRLPSAPSSWDRVLEEIRQWPDTAIISHEFFGAATPEQAKRALDALAPAEVHVVFTARDYVKQIPGAWQERLKYKSRTRFSEYVAADDEGGPLTEMGWRTYDISGVLGRWGPHLPPDRVHVVTVPQQGAPGVLWERFATLCGIDPSSCDTNAASPNQSLGAAEAELLRRVNYHIGPPIEPPGELAVWIRDFLAHGILVARGGQRFGLPPEAIPKVRERAQRGIDAVAAAGYDVVGDLSELLPPAEQPKLPHPDEVTDSELLEVAVETIAEMLQHVREQTLRAKQEKRRADEAERALARVQAGASRDSANGSGPIRRSLVALSERHPAVMRARVGYRRAVNAARGRLVNTSR